MNPDKYASSVKLEKGNGEGRERERDLRDKSKLGRTCDAMEGNSLGIPAETNKMSGLCINLL